MGQCGVIRVYHPLENFTMTEDVDLIEGLSASGIRCFVIDENTTEEELDQMFGGLFKHDR